MFFWSYHILDKQCKPVMNEVYGLENEFSKKFMAAANATDNDAMVQYSMGETHDQQFKFIPIKDSTYYNIQLQGTKR